MPLSFANKLRSHALVLAAVVGLWAPWRPATSEFATALRPGHHHPVTIHLASEAVVGPGPRVSFDYPRAELPQQPEVASLAIPGRNGVYLVPYIQTGPDLHYRLRVQDLPPRSMVLVTLDPDRPGSRIQQVTGPTFDGTFTGVEMGEHTLLAELYARPRWTHQGETGYDRVAAASLSHVARGDIIAALGDSTTEGNGGPKFGFLRDWTSALANAADWTSPDGRNFPQAGAVAHPSALASFTTTLGTLLEQQLGHPVLVLNDGWSGATAEAYSHIAASPDLAAEYAVAHPTTWIINLGVNDPLTHQAPQDFANSVISILGSLEGRYGAQPGSIHLACPTYAKDSRHDGETTYLPVINQLRADNHLGPAPDFFNFYKARPGDEADEVHPNSAGYRDMAIVWAQALGGQDSACG